MGLLTRLKKWIQIKTVGKANVGIKENVDIYAYHINGELFAERHIRNVVTTAGVAEMAGLCNGSAGTAFTFIGVGRATAALDEDDTALGDEITDSGLARAAAVCTQETETHTNDVAQLVKSFSVTGTQAVCESGVFNDASAGDMLCGKTFSVINVANGDTLEITWRAQFTN